MLVCIFINLFVPVNFCFFFLFEALASSHIRRFSFQFVHCRSFRVRRRPCFFGTYIIINEWDKCVAENFWVLFDMLNHPIVSRLCDTLIYNVSRLCDTITEMWYFMNLNFSKFEKTKKNFCSKNNLIWKFGTGALLVLLDEKTNFPFYTVLIRLEIQGDPTEME